MSSKATLTLLYRLLFLLHAESRDLLPRRKAAGLKLIQEEVEDQAGDILDDAAERHRQRLLGKEDPALRPPGRPVPGGGSTRRAIPSATATALLRGPLQHAVRRLRQARASDRPVPEAAQGSRPPPCPGDRPSLQGPGREDAPPRAHRLPGSCEVRHLGSIHEGLLELKLILADEDKAIRTEKGRERYVALNQAKGRRGKPARSHSCKRRGLPVQRQGRTQVHPAPTLPPTFDRPRYPRRAERSRTGAGRQAGGVAARVPHAQGKPPGVSVPGERPAGGPPPRRRGDVRRAPRSRGAALRSEGCSTPASGSGHFLVRSGRISSPIASSSFLAAFPGQLPRPAPWSGPARRSWLRSAEEGVIVDPGRLSDVNMLKRRQVLNRCIYGVDLNLMAAVHWRRSACGSTPSWWGSL